MIIHPIVTNNSLQNIFYILKYGENQALIIDPCDSKLAQDFLDSHDVKLERILITHEHYDHYDGVEGLSCNEVYAGRIAAENMPIRVIHTFEDGEKIFEYGDLVIRAIFTPGHASGHMMFELSEKGKVTSIFSGDVLFQGGVGHTRRGSNRDLYESVSKFEKYDDEVIIYSGHDYFENNSSFIRKYFPEKSLELDTLNWEMCDKPYFTTLGQERTYNPFIGQTLEEFSRIRELRNNF